MSKVVEGYMDLVDFYYELGAAKGGNTIHASIKDLKERHSCVDECGIVKVKVELVEIIKNSDFQPAADYSNDEEIMEQQYQNCIKNRLEAYTKLIKYYTNILNKKETK